MIFRKEGREVVLIDEERERKEYLLHLEKSFAFAFALLTCASGIWTGPCDMNVYDVLIFSCV